jgi:hypothetical protein
MSPPGLHLGDSLVGLQNRRWKVGLTGAFHPPREALRQARHRKPDQAVDHFLLIKKQFRGPLGEPEAKRWLSRTHSKKSMLRIMIIHHNHVGLDVSLCREGRQF